MVTSSKKLTICTSGDTIFTTVSNKIMFTHDGSPAHGSCDRIKKTYFLEDGLDVMALKNTRYRAFNFLFWENIIKVENLKNKIIEI